MKRRTKTAAALLLTMTLTAGAIPVQNSMGSFLTGITASAAQEKAIGSKVYWQTGDTIGEKQYRFSAYTWVSRVLNSADSGEKIS